MIDLLNNNRQKLEISDQNEKIKDLKTQLESEKAQRKTDVICFNIKIEELNNKIKTDQQLFDGVLLNAAEKNNIEKIKSAIIFDANIEAKNEKGQTALHLAVVNQHHDMSDFLISEKPSLFIMADNAGLTPIQHIAQAGQLDMLDWLYEKGKSISEFSNYQAEFDKVYDIASQDAKLFLANKKLLESAKFGKIEGCIDALSKGADVNVKASDGETALHKTVYHQYENLTQLLIDKGADSTIRNNKQDDEVNRQHENVLDFAIKAKNQAFISMVATPFLIFAANHGATPDILVALDADAKLGGVDTSGQTALHKAVRTGNTDVIKLLLKKHAEAKVDIHISDQDGNTPYDLAVKLGITIKTKTGEKNLEIYLLEKFGAYKKEVKLREKQTKLSTSPFSFVASANQGVGLSSPSNIQELRPAHS